jgi:hypothetical protein
MVQDEKKKKVHWATLIGGIFIYGLILAAVISFIYLFWHMHENNGKMVAGCEKLCLEEYHTSRNSCQGQTCRCEFNCSDTVCHNSVEYYWSSGDVFVREA